MIPLAGIDAAPHAGVAQSVEQLICNQQVGGSSPSTSSIVGADCAYSFPRKRENSFASSHLLLAPRPLRRVAPRKRGIIGDSSQLNIKSKRQLRFEEEPQRRERAFGLGRKRDDPELAATTWGCSRVAKGDRL